jgi:Rrf2 family nitric oxide-sensitive transcriptional repressor
MQLTQFTDYSLRTLVYLSSHPERLSTVAEIALAFQISENHLTKVVNRLASYGYIETVRGRGGGMHLARAPQLINIGAVVRDMEEHFDVVECFNAQKQTCPLLPACALKAALHEARRNFMGTLDRYTLKDVVGGTGAPLFAEKRIALARGQ